MFETQVKDVSERSYKKLPKRFTRSGWDYTELKRIGMIAFYEMRYIKGKKIQGYSSVKIRNRGPRKLATGKMDKAREVFPCPEDFGKWGDYYGPCDEHLAWKRFYEMVEQAKQR